MVTPSRIDLARLIAVAAGAAHVAAPRLTALPQDPTGPTVGIDGTDPVLTGIGIAAVLGSALAGRLPTIGAAVVTASSILSAFLVSVEFRPVVLLLSLPLVLAAGLLLLPSSGADRPSVESRRSVLGALLLSGVVLWRLVEAYTDRHDPTHPDSTATKPNWVADWMWLGAVSSTAASIVAGGLTGTEQTLEYWEDGSGARRLVTASISSYGLARFELTGLTSGAVVNYAIVGGASGTNNEPDASFRTQRSNPSSVRVAFGSCARTGSNGAVFDAIVATEPDLFVQLGDLHYGNLTSNRPEDHIVMLGRSLSTPAQSAMYSSIPTAWIWDDHDFGPNDSDSTSPARDAVLDAYRQAVPHWGVAPDLGAPINQAFSVGPVRVVTTDTRSQRTDATMLGSDQVDWLISELIASSQSHSVVVWANPTPWNFPEREGSDVWGGFPDERRRIANAIAEAAISNLVMISGDWHLAAIDDGSNTGYADDGSLGFPLIHGAPLDRPGSRTNDPYSHGVFSNAGQFGTVDVVDNGNGLVEVALTARLWNGEELASYSYVIES